MEFDIFFVSFAKGYRRLPVTNKQSVIDWTLTKSSTKHLNKFYGQIKRNLKKRRVIFLMRSHGVSGVSGLQTL